MCVEFLFPFALRLFTYVCLRGNIVFVGVLLFEKCCFARADVNVVSSSAIKYFYGMLHSLCQTA